MQEQQQIHREHFVDLSPRQDKAKTAKSRILPRYYRRRCSPFSRWPV